MGFIRGVLVIIISFLLLITLLAMNLSLTFNLSLQYENVKEVVGPEIKKTVNEEVNLYQEVNQRLPELLLYCETNTEFIFSEQGYTFVIPCEKAYEGVDVLINESIDSVIESTYYKEYDCKFWDCLKEQGTPFFLVSEKSKDYWKGNFIMALIASLILILILFLLVSGKHNAFVIPGFLLLLASLPFIRFGIFSSLTKDTVLLSFIKIFFSKSKEVFAISLTAGIILIVIGILIKLFMIGFRISEWFGKTEEIKQQVVVSPTPKPKSKEGVIKKFFLKLRGKKKQVAASHKNSSRSSAEKINVKKI